MGLVIACSSVLADNETLSYIDENNQQVDPSTLGRFYPCASITVQLNYKLPSGKDGICKIDWYNESYQIIATTTTNRVTFTLAQTQLVACTVYYWSGVVCANNSQVNVTGVYFYTKVMNLLTPTASLTTVPSGCQNGINFSSAFGPESNEHFVPGAGSYTVNWNLPTGWTNAPQAMSTTATPDATNGGNASVTVTLNACAHSATSAPLAITRSLPPPMLANSNPVTVCNGANSARFNLSPESCGAGTYTFSVSGHSGATFALNGLQTLTTSNPYADINFSGVPNQSEFTLSVTSHYPGGTSSATNKTFYYGLPVWITSVQGFDNDVCTNSAQYPYVGLYPGEGSINYQWSVTYAPTPWSYSINNNGSSNCTMYFWAPGDYNIQVEVTTACGPVYTYGFVTVSDCFNARMSLTSPSGSDSINMTLVDQRLVYPNPAKDMITVNLANMRARSKNAGGHVEVHLLSLNGTLIKKMPAISGKPMQINTSHLSSGIYIVKIIDGQQVTSKKVVVRH
jgi:hypothetical protein